MSLFYVKINITTLHIWKLENNQSSDEVSLREKRDETSVSTFTVQINTNYQESPTRNTMNGRKREEKQTSIIVFLQNQNITQIKPLQSQVRTIMFV